MNKIRMRDSLLSSTNVSSSALMSSSSLSPSESSSLCGICCASWASLRARKDNHTHTSQRNREEVGGGKDKKKGSKIINLNV